MTLRFKLSNAFARFAVLFTIVLLAPSNAEAHSPHAREALAIVQTINYEKRTLSVSYPQGHGPRKLIWNSDTKFLHDWKFVPATELKEGVPVTVYYHSPVFGKPFVAKVVWTNAK